MEAGRNPWLSPASHSLVPCDPSNHKGLGLWLVLALQQRLGCVLAALAAPLLLLLAGGVVLLLCLGIKFIYIKCI